MLKGAAPWQSQVTRLNTVSNMLTVTTRTPASTSRRKQAALAERRAAKLISEVIRLLSDVEGIFGQGLRKRVGQACSCPHPGCVRVEVWAGRVRAQGKRITAAPSQAERLSMRDVDPGGLDRPRYQGESGHAVSGSADMRGQRAEMGRLLARAAQPAGLEKLAARLVDGGLIVIHRPDDRQAIHPHRQTR